MISRALGVATLICVPFGVVDGSQSSFSWGSLAACAAVGIGGTGIAYAFAGWLTGRVGAVRMSIVTYVIPLVSIVLGVVFRDETVSVGDRRNDHRAHRGLPEQPSRLIARGGTGQMRVSGRW